MDNGKNIKVWYGKEGDFLEVLFKKESGRFRETRKDAVMEKVDDKGYVIGFSILKVSSLSHRKPRFVTLKSSVA